MSRRILALFLGVVFLALIMGPAQVMGTKPCPWKISNIAVSKWANGKIKAAIWAHGSFPINIPGVTERPIWIVNGINHGRATTFFNTKRIINGSYSLKPKAQNKVTVKFTKPPYAGASHTYTFYYDPARIPPGGYVQF